MDLMKSVFLKKQRIIGVFFRKHVQLLPIFKLSFLCLLFSLLAFSFLNAQVVYSDIVPDRGFSSKNTIDINKDGITDFTLDLKITVKYDADVYSYKIIASETAQVAITADSASMLMLGDTIDENLNWSSVNEVYLLYFWGEYHVVMGNWIGKDKGFLGLRIQVDSQYYYAWLRVNLLDRGTETAPLMWTADFAFESTAGKAIVSGDGIPVGATSVFGRDLNDFDEGLDIRASFTKAIDESLLSEYRVILAKADDTSAYSLDVMNQLPANKYYSVLIDTSDSLHIVQINLTEETVDKDGDLVTKLTDYRLHLLNVSRTANPEENILSVPSSVFYLRAIPKAVKSQVVWDNGDANSSADIRISFSRIAKELYLSEYRIFVATVDAAQDFEAQTATSLSDEYYTSVLPNGNNLEVSINENQKDIEGNPIKNDIRYQTIILSLADSNYAKTSTLSRPSKMFILKSPSYLFAGQNTGDNINYFEYDSLFSLDSIWKEDYGTPAETYVDLNRDGLNDFILYGKNDYGNMYYYSQYFIQGERDNLVLICAHSEHTDWIDVLSENEAIGEDYNWSNNKTTLLYIKQESFGGTNIRRGHYPGRRLYGTVFYVGLCIMDNSEPQYAWLRINGNKFIDYAFQDINIGIKDHKKTEERFRIFPNPSNEFIQIQTLSSDALFSSPSATVMNSMGIKVDEFEFSRKMITKDISAYSPGLYFFVFRDSNSATVLETHRLIVQ